MSQHDVQSVTDEQNENSPYDERLKSRVADEIVHWLCSTKRVRDDEIEAYQNLQHEAYVTIELKHVPDEFDWSKEVIRNQTSDHLDSVHITGSTTANIVPDDVYT